MRHSGPLVFGAAPSERLHERNDCASQAVSALLFEVHEISVPVPTCAANEPIPGCPSSAGYHRRDGDGRGLCGPLPKSNHLRAPSENMRVGAKRRPSIAAAECLALDAKLGPQQSGVQD